MVGGPDQWSAITSDNLDNALNTWNFEYFHESESDESEEDEEDDIDGQIAWPQLSLDCENWSFKCNPCYTTCNTNVT